jgi:hypothetical protein
MATSFPLASLAATTASVALGVFSLVNLSLFVLLLRERQSSTERRGRLSLWVPAVGAIASVGFLILELRRNLGSPSSAAWSPFG